MAKRGRDLGEAFRERNQPKHYPRNDLQRLTTPALTKRSVDHPVIRHYYPETLTLGTYLQAQLPRNFAGRPHVKARLDKAAGWGRPDDELSRFLHHTLVGLPARRDDEEARREEDLVKFSQEVSPHLSESSLSGSSYRHGEFSQSEVVDFVVWRLIHAASNKKPLTNILCQNIPNSHYKFALGGRPGLIRAGEVARFKSAIWSRIHALLGRAADAVMIDLLSNCAIFTPIEGSLHSFIQICGTPLTRTKPVSHLPPHPRATHKPDDNAPEPAPRHPSSITFVRSRMLYAKPALNAKGGVRLGLQHIHVLNRCPNVNDPQQTVHILRHIFPRQYGLHNVFTSTPDARETAMAFQDYTLRDREIHEAMCRDLGPRLDTPGAVLAWKLRTTKRTSSGALFLVRRMRQLHSRCSYTKLLNHYCPVDLRRAADHSRATDPPPLTAMACPTQQVSAFCKAVVQNVIPNGFWGSPQNQAYILFCLHNFICMRRFESSSLHDVFAPLAVSLIDWLRPRTVFDSGRMCINESEKRGQVLQEFLYWLFDSFLIPLVRSNFYVTESNTDRNRLFYFRHDVWRRLTEPSLAAMRTSLFEELPAERATRMLASRPLGFSKIRLLPKTSGVRYITNLKRRPQTTYQDRTVLGRSINSVMAPVFNVLTYERARQPELFGSSLFSVGDMRPRLAAFRESLRARNQDGRPLYFAKVDVQSCFDTIPQARLLSLVASLVSMDAYQTGKHVQVSAVGQLQRLVGEYVQVPPIRRYTGHCTGPPGDDTAAAFEQLVEARLAGGRANTVFVDVGPHRSETKHSLLQLLREHVERNVVRVGKRFYRQKTGIPQGSVLSTILCNFFYAEFERDWLPFTADPNCLLLRLLDDFCLVTPERRLAQEFVETMHRGSAEYGVVVKRSKSLANFDVSTEGGFQVARSEDDGQFPYCGVTIDTRTLEVSRKTERLGYNDVQDALTVDASRVPGQTFHRKTLNGLKMQLHALFTDTVLNTIPRVLANLHQTFLTTANRCYAYLRSLSEGRTTHSSLLITPIDAIDAIDAIATIDTIDRRITRGPAMSIQPPATSHTFVLGGSIRWLGTLRASDNSLSFDGYNGTVDSLIALAFVMVRRRSRSRLNSNQDAVRRVIPRRHIHWLACKAFSTVFQRRQTKYRALLDHLARELAAARPAARDEVQVLEEAAAAGVHRW